MCLCYYQQLINLSLLWLVVSDTHEHMSIGSVGTLMKSQSAINHYMTGHRCYPLVWLYVFWRFEHHWSWDYLEVEVHDTVSPPLLWFLTILDNWEASKTNWMRIKILTWVFIVCNCIQVHWDCCENSLNFICW